MDGYEFLKKHKRRIENATETEREAFYETIKRARLEKRETALAIMCMRLVSTASREQLKDLRLFIEKG